MSKIECSGCEEVECQQCCDHYDTEDGQCLDCGLDRTEELSAKAYDMFKDRWKYGDE